MKSSVKVPYGQLRDLLKQGAETKYFNEFVIGDKSLQYTIGFFGEYYDIDSEKLFEDEMFDICFNEITMEDLQDFIKVEQRLSNYTRIKIERLLNYGE